MENKELKKLLDQYLSETIGPSEIDHLLDTLQQEYDKEQWQEAIEGMLQNKELHGLSDPFRMEQLMQAILTTREDYSGRAIVRSPFAGWWKYAAILLLLMVSAGMFWKFSRNKAPSIIAGTDNSQRFKNDIHPGGNKATLTLSNGSRVILDSVSNGAVSRQGNVSVLKSDSGQLVYNNNRLNEKPAVVLYNTISTPSGGQYHLTLSDGTGVWLNATSSLRFPVLFSGNERAVELNGEAYFEVAGNEKYPFSVKVNGVSVQVLGTHFNVNAYEDEPAIMTTLLEGKVRVMQGNSGVLLQPGQQAQSVKDKEIKVLKDPDLDEVMAWKNGVFQLKSAGIKTIMRQVARWYDVEVKYEGDEINQTFYGTIPRNVSAISLFKVLEETGGVRFKIDGRVVTVSP